MNIKPMNQELYAALKEALETCIWRADTALPLSRGECQRINDRCEAALAAWDQESTHQRIARITEELREIYQNTNEGPLLIHSMVVREFPYPRRVWNDPVTAGGKAGWGNFVTSAPSGY